MITTHVLDTARGRPAADVVHQLAKGHPERCLEQPAVLHVARQLDRHGAARAVMAQSRIGFGALGQDEGRGA
jgi:5-hydroxyisourate hydrolase-like protein (transthyretin family)